MADPLGNLCGPGKALRAEAPDAAEISGLTSANTKGCSKSMSAWWMA